MESELGNLIATIARTENLKRDLEKKLYGESDTEEDLRDVALKLNGMQDYLNGLNDALSLVGGSGDDLRATLLARAWRQGDYLTAGQILKTIG